MKYSLSTLILLLLITSCSHRTGHVIGTGERIHHDIFDRALFRRVRIKLY